MNDSDSAAPRTAARFDTTHWSVVLASRDRASPESVEAWDRLCRAYWYPLYAFVRRQGFGPADAEDLTQGFFTRLLQRDAFASVCPERGRFRSFLLVALKHYLANQREQAEAHKRGGGTGRVPLDTSLGETLYQAEPASLAPGERLFERRWALTLLRRALDRLRSEAAAAGKDAEFDHLKGLLTAAEPAIPMAQVAARFGCSEGAARVAVHRLRRRFRDLFRAEIAATVAEATQIDEEIRHLVDVLADAGTLVTPS